MGDTTYWRVLRGLAETENPAIKIDESINMSSEWNKHWHVELLSFGEDLLQNRGDWLVSNTVERWVGGMRINSRQTNNWRVDDNGGVEL